jgi:hypothetical protein
MPNEPTLDFGEHCRRALEEEQCPLLTEEQRSALIALDKRLDGMSGEKNAELWSEDTLQNSSEWEEVGREARKILDSFGWPLRKLPWAADPL